MNQREIKFRGQRLDNKEWVYGYMVVDPAGGYRIYWQPFADATSNTYHFIIPETASQLTGLKDKNGKEIYESDIVRILYTDWISKSASDPRSLEEYLNSIAHVGNVEFMEDRWQVRFNEDSTGDMIPGRHGFIEVIGNVFETPELLTA